MHHGGAHLLLACVHPLLRWATAISCCRSGTVMLPGAGVGRVLLGGGYGYSSGPSISPASLCSPCDVEG
eukprot:482538-Prymnesium_polylepis.1